MWLYSQKAKRNKAVGSLGIHGLFLLQTGALFYFDASIEFILANCIEISFKLFAMVYITHITKTSDPIEIAITINIKIANSVIFLDPLSFVDIV